MTLLLKKKKDKIGGMTLPGMWWLISHCHLNNVKWLWKNSKDQQNRREGPEIDSQIEGKLSHESKDTTSPWEKNRIFDKCFCDNCPSKWETQLHLYIMAYPHPQITAEFPSGKTAQNSSSLDGGDHSGLPKSSMVDQLQRKPRMVHLTENVQDST